MSVKLNLEVDPSWFRKLFLAFALGALGLIWGAYLASNHTIRSSVERGLVQDAQSSALVLEDHASRALDAVAARLRFVGSITSWGTIWSQRLSSDYLRGLTSETPMLRSLSLVDEKGLVLASSDPHDVGLILPVDKLPPEGALGAVTFGRVYPVRDLHELLDDSVRTDVDLWLGAMAVELDGSRMRWIAGVNPGYFYNFWSRVDTEGDYEFSLFDYSGRYILGINRIAGAKVALEKALGDALLDRDLGFVELGPDARWKLAYRGSPTHPFVFAVVGDSERAFARQAREERQRLAAAFLASIAVLGIILVIFRAYQRYELSVTEMLNQSRAISAHLMVSESDHDGNIIAANAAFLSRTGYNEVEIIGKNHRIFNTGLYDKAFYADLWGTVKSGEIWKGLFRNRDASGSHYWVDATIVPFRNPWGRIVRFVCFYSDITDAVKLGEELRDERYLRQKLARLNQTLLTEATTDGLTGVSNRRGFAQFCAEAVEQSRNMYLPISILMLDLDHFKSVNDGYGHSAGDIVLREMAQRWAAQIRTSDLLARLGGEEFCVVLPNTPISHAVEVAEKLCAATRSKPVAILADGQAIELGITVSIGVASSEQIEVTDVEQLLALADEALYEAKRNGRDRLCRIASNKRSAEK